MVDNIDNDLHIESSEITGPEEKYWFNSTIETLDWDKFWSIREIKMERKWESSDNMIKTFSFRIDDASKTLTVDQIKKIMHNEYGYHEAAFSVNIIGKNNTKWSTICTNNDVIHIIVDVNRNKELKAQSSQQIDTTVYENNSGKEADERDIKQESPYKEMIEKQTKPIDSDPTKTEIAITIDDWYYPDQIKRMLDILDKKHIKATFFALWEVIAKNTNIRKDIINKWHQVCCHTYSHAYIEDAEYTELFKWHGISESSRIEHAKQREKYVKTLLPDEYDRIREENPDAPRKVNTATLLDAEIHMWEIQVKKSLWEEYFDKMKKNFPFFRFPWKIWANRPENIAILKKYGYLSIGWTQEPWKDTHKIWPWWIMLLHSNKKIADHFEQYLDDSWIIWTQVTDIITPK